MFKSKLLSIFLSALIFNLASCKTSETSPSLTQGSSFVDNEESCKNEYKDLTSQSPKFKKIGIYSGSFDPVTLAHQAIIEHALKDYKLDHLFVLVNFDGVKNYHVSNNDRIEMMKIAIQALQSKITVHKIHFKCKAYVNSLLQNITQEEFIFIGQDSYEKLPLDQKFNNQLVFVVFPREGESTELPKEKNVEVYSKKNFDIAISSTVVRKNIKEKKSVNHLMNPKVLEYIEKHSFYKK